jgi:hypothetical protein
MLRRCRHLTFILAVSALAAALSPARAGEPFPFGTELMLDATPESGSKRLPMIQIEDDGGRCDRFVVRQRARPSDRRR